MCRVRTNALYLLLVCGLILAGQRVPAEEEAPQQSSDELEELIGSWYPRTVTGPRGTAVIHAPQITAWEDFDSMTGRVAFSITAADSEHTFHGTTRFRARTDTDLAEREVLLHDAQILELRIDGLAEDSTEYQIIEDGLKSTSRTVPLDLVLEYLPQEIQVESESGLNSEPPPIFTSTEPAILLYVDSEAIFIPLEDTGLKFALNTNWDVLRVADSAPYYMCYESSWLTADEISAEWNWASSLPDGFAGIPDDANWSNAHACLPDDIGAIEAPARSAPRVFYTSEPAELILLDGDPQWQSIGAGAPDFASNTQQELFRVDNEIFFLASGRWFRSDSLDGSWNRVTALPEAFHDIPEEDADNAHAKSYIRKSVPGTREAWEAALVASIPRKATIVRGTESELNLDVNYAGGEPAFVPIETTDIEMAVNTSYQVLRYDDTYYLCHNAVWFTSSVATGPWQYADSIPTEFLKIPPSSPAYNTTFVTVDGSDGETIDYEYSSGYEGIYVEDDTVVQGTGFATSAMAITIAYGIYDGWWGYPYYPYYPWPPTYGYGSWYNPDTGRYGEAVVGYGPYGAAGGAAVFNPETGVYARGQAVWDSDEYAGRGYAYNPNTETSFARNRYVDFEDDEGWSQNVARRGDEWRYSESEWKDGEMVTEFESSRGTEGTVYRERDGDSITSEGTISGENRSATFQGSFEDGQGNMTLQGSEGGTGELNRQIDDGEISGSGTFTRDGQTIETDVTRTAEGVSRDIEGSVGGQAKTVRQGDESAFIAESGSGDVYAGHDGNVYQRTDDGWEQVENPGASGTASNERQRGRQEASTQRTGTDRTAGTQSGNAQYQRSDAQRSYDYQNTSRQLDRDYQSRQRGFDRYSQHQSTSRGASSRGRSRGRRRR